MAKDDDTARDKAADGNARQQIDPRYDPVFQRGYHGEAHTSVRSNRRGTLPAREQRPKRDERPDAYAEMPTIRGAAETGSAHVGSATGVDRGAGVTPAVQAGDVDFADDVDRPIMPPSRINPYIVALWIIGIVLLAGGVFVQWWAVTSQVNGGFSSQSGVPLRVVLISLASTVSGPMITVGIATIVGLIFVLATKGRHATASGVDAP